MSPAGSPLAKHRAGQGSTHAISGSHPDYERRAGEAGQRARVFAFDDTLNAV